MKTINANSNLIKRKNNNQYLIKLPKSGFMFWYPVELISFSGKNNNLMTIQYMSDRYFHVFRYGKGYYSCHQIIDEDDLPASEWEKYFYQYKIN